MKIKYITDDALAQCRQNVDTIYEEVVCLGRQSLPDLFHCEHLIKEMSLDIPKITLVMSEKAPHLTDACNAEIVYEAMQGLSDSQASEEKLWAAYTFHEQLDYMKYRWPAKDVNAMKNHYLFSYGARKSLFRNGISRLWWLGRITKDVSRKNPYELTKYVCEHTDAIQSICEQPVCQQPRILRGVIKALYDLDRTYELEEADKIPLEERKGVHIHKIIIQDLGKYLNLLSGTYLLDMYDEQKMYDIVCKHIRKAACK